MKLFTIISVVKNSEEFITTSFNSLKNQNYKNFEHIIVDGGSKDNTLKILKDYKKNKNNISLYKFKDKKIYESLNFAIKKAKGKYIGILHSDDQFFSKNTLKIIKNEIYKKKPDVIYGNILFCKRYNETKIVRNFISGKFNSNLIYKGWHFPHTSMFILNDLYKKLNGYNTDFKIASDYDLMLRIIRLTKKISYINKYTTIMKAGGTSNKSLISIFKANYECWLSLKSNNYNNSLMIIIYKVFNKLLQIRL